MNALIFRDDFSGEVFQFSKDEAQHLKVKRVYDSITQVTLRDGNGKELIYERSNSEFRLVKTNILVKPIGLEICTAFPKAGKWEFYIQKATELSVSEINIISWERSQNFPVPIDRIRKIEKEAGIQSNQKFLPKVNLIKNKDTISGDCFYLDPNAEESFHPEILKSSKPLIGPEGGFTNSELEWMKGRNYPGFRLGGSIFRIETAGIYMAVCYYQNHYL
jgi:16S rRNA (uracil1498-N3)-methyltransferase